MTLTVCLSRLQKQLDWKKAEVRKMKINNYTAESIRAVALDRDALKYAISELMSKEIQ